MSELGMFNGVDFDYETEITGDGSEYNPFKTKDKRLSSAEFLIEYLLRNNIPESNDFYVSNDSVKVRHMVKEERALKQGIEKSSTINWGGGYIWEQDLDRRYEISGNGSKKSPFTSDQSQFVSAFEFIGYLREFYAFGTFYFSWKDEGVKRWTTGNIEEA